MSLRPPPFLAIAFVAALTLAGCSTSPTSGPTATPTTSAPATDPTLVFLPEGTAFDNKAFFDQVLRPVAEASHPSPSHAMVDALVAAGFLKNAMQATPDKTKTGLDADSVFVAVKIDKLCLVAQRTSGREFTSSVESALKSGDCLIGNTQKIDW